MMHFAVFSTTPRGGTIGAESTLAGLLAVRGARTTVIVCDSAVPRCVLDPDFAEAMPRAELCRQCSSETVTRHYYGARGVSALLRLSHLIPQDQLAHWQQRIDACPNEELYSFNMLGYPLGEWIQVALRIEYFGEHWVRLPDYTTISRQWLATLVRVVLAAEAFIRDQKPDAILLLNGLAASERAISAVARRHGIRCIMYDTGPRPDTTVMREKHPACLYRFDDEWQEWASVPLSRAESHRLDMHLASRQKLKTPTLYVLSPAATGDLDGLRQQLRLPPGRRTFVAYTNLMADTSVYVAARAFPSQVDWLNACIAYALHHPEIDLIIRCHPAEHMAIVRSGKAKISDDQTNQEILKLWPVLPDNVRVVAPDDATSSYDLLALADVVLVYVSTVGMEAAVLGKPVVIAGGAHYWAIGFGWPVERRGDFDVLLDRLVHSPDGPPRAVEIARRYLYLYMFRGNFALLPDVPDWGEIGHPAEILGQGALAPLTEDDFIADRAHLVAYLLGERPYLLPPAPWRPRDGDGGQLAHPGDEPLFLGLPDWADLAGFWQRHVRALVADGGKGRLALLVDAADAGMAHEALARASWDTGRMVVALQVIGPDDQWARRLCEASALLIADGQQASRIVGMAREVALPIFTGWHADLWSTVWAADDATKGPALDYGFGGEVPDPWVLRRRLEEGADAGLHFRLALGLLPLQDLRGACRHLRAVLQLTQDDPARASLRLQAIVQLIALELDLGHPDRAWTLIRAAAETANEHAGYWINRAIAGIHTGDLMDAEASLWRANELISLDRLPPGWTAEMALGFPSLMTDVLVRQGKATEAVPFLRQVIQAGGVPAPLAAGWIVWMAQRIDNETARGLVSLALWQHPAEPSLVRMGHALAQRLPIEGIRPIEPLFLRIPPRRERLSVCMIVKDEAAQLSRSLLSVSTVADEIIVVDTGSTDHTMAIAASYGATISQCAWPDHFGQARNLSVDLATGDWILVIDADEALDVQGQSVLDGLLAGLPDAPDAFNLTIVPLDAEGRLCGPDYATCRLFRRRGHLHFRGRIHEQVVSTDPDRPATYRWLDGVTLWHYGYAPEVIAERHKLERNLALLEMAVAEEPGNPFHYFNLGTTRFACDQVDAAQAAWEHCLTLCRPLAEPPPYLLAVYIKLLKLALRSGRFQQGLDWVRAGQACGDRVPSFWLHAGLVALAAEQAETAVAFFERALALPEPEGYIAEHEQHWRAKAHAGLAEALLPLDRPAEALRHVRQARTLLPGDPTIDQIRLRVMAAQSTGIPGRISLCLIARDEAGQLAECLASAGDLADEVIVVDTGSRDATAALARAAGATVIELPWADDFGAARNAALAKAAGDWVLMLDADERVAPQALPLLRAVCRRDADDGTAYLLPVVEASSGDVSWALRLFRHHDDLTYLGTVAERLAHREHGVDWLQVHALPEAPLVHVNSATDRLRKLTRNRQLLEQAEATGDPHQCLQLALWWLAEGDRARAGTLLHGLIADPCTPESMRAMVYRQAIDCADSQYEALQLAEEAIDACPAAGELWLVCGQLWAARGDLGRAAGMLRHSLWLRERDGRGLGGFGEFAWLPEQALGRIHLRLGEAHVAIPLLRRAVAADPTQWESRRLLMAAYLRLGQSDRAIDLLKDLDGLPADDRQQLVVELDRLIGAEQVEAQTAATLRAAVTH